MICMENTRQMPEMHMSLVPMLQRVPSIAESPHGTISVSSESVQYNSHGSSIGSAIEANEILTTNTIGQKTKESDKTTHGYQSMVTNCTCFRDMFRC